jgi:uncharacterized protein (TIGR00369 family)
MVVGRSPTPSLISASELERMAREEVQSVGRYGVKVEAVEAGRLRVRLPFDPTSIRPGGTISGPAMMGLADYTIYGVVMSLIGPVKLAVTTNLNCNFLRKPKPGDLIAEGSMLKLGKRLAVGEVSIFSDGEDEPVAHVVATYSIPPDAGEGA